MHLQSNDELGLPFPGQVHIAKLATPQGFANVKVSQLPSPVLVTAVHRAPAACCCSLLPVRSCSACLGVISCLLSHPWGRWPHGLRRRHSILCFRNLVLSRLERCSDTGRLTVLGLLFCWLQASPVSRPLVLQEVCSGHVLLQEEYSGFALVVVDFKSTQLLQASPCQGLRQSGQTLPASSRPLSDRFTQTRQNMMRACSSHLPDDAFRASRLHVACQVKGTKLLFQL